MDRRVPAGGARTGLGRRPQRADRHPSCAKVPTSRCSLSARLCASLRRLHAYSNSQTTICRLPSRRGSLQRGCSAYNRKTAQLRVSSRKHHKTFLRLDCYVDGRYGSVACT
jgi:hypothetical protein